MYPILKSIYETMNEDDIVILSAGHAGLAQYVCIEEKYGHDAEQLIHDHGIHPVRDVARKIHTSSGSLGSAILIAVGLAMANTSRCVHCLISDGECAEGSVWEALAFIRKHKIANIHIHVNINGYSAYDEVDCAYLQERLFAFDPNIQVHRTHNPNLPYLNTLNGHYHVLKNENEYHELLDVCGNNE